MQKLKFLLIIFIISAMSLSYETFFFTPKADAGVCQTGHIINPITDIDWLGIFPIRIGGLSVGPGIPDKQDTVRPVCLCLIPVGDIVVPKPGITLSFWSPAHFTEVVEEPYCFAALGFQIPIGAASLYGNGSIPKKIHSYAFYQSHYYDFPIWAILGLLTDLICLQSPLGSSISIPFITEVDPIWQSDILATFANPEAILFANPIAQFSCAADSLTAQVYQPIDAMFWCEGAWGSIFPVDGDTGGSKDSVEDAAAIAGKMQFLMHEYALQLGTVGPLTYTGTCQNFYDPIWQQAAVRYDLSMPIPEPFLQPVGQTSIAWSWGKDIPYIGGNYVFTTFNEQDCCAF